MVPILVALCAAVATICGSCFVHSATKLQHKKNDDAKLLECVKSAAHSFAMLQQPMDWVSWYGGNCPNRVDDEMIAKYERTMYREYVRALRAIISVGMYDISLYRSLIETHNKIEDLDCSITLLFSSEDAAQKKQSFELVFEASQKLREEWSEQLANALNRIFTRLN